MQWRRALTGCVSFLRHLPQLGYHSNVPWASRRSFNIIIIKPIICSILAENSVNINRGTPVKQRTYVYQRTPCKSASKCQRLLGKVYEIFIRRRGIIGGVNWTIHVAILPSVVERQRTAWWQGASIFADTGHKSVTIATSFDRAVAVWIHCYKAH